MNGIFYITLNDAWNVCSNDVGDVGGRERDGMRECVRMRDG
jgi:hypothetical protein